MSERLADKLPRRRLGRTGWEVAALGLGGAGIGGGYGGAEEDSAIEAVRMAVDQGIDLIDPNVWENHRILFDDDRVFYILGR